MVALSFLGLLLLPVNFSYWAFAGLLVLNGIGSGLFSAPNTTAIMNSVPASQRGQASGMRGTFFNAGSALSIGVFFSLMIAGLAASLPNALRTGLTRPSCAGRRGRLRGHPAAGQQSVRGLPRLQPDPDSRRSTHPRLAPAGDRSTLTGKEFFPQLISGPFHHGLVIVFSVAIGMSLIGAVASLLRGHRYVHGESPAPTPVTPSEAVTA